MPLYYTDFSIDGDILLIQQNGPSDWMLVDKHMVDLTGTVCNKVGVSYTGFRQQPGRCDRAENS